MAIQFPVMDPNGNIVPDDEALAFRNDRDYKSFVDLNGVSPLVLAWEPREEDSSLVQNYRYLICDILRFLDGDRCNFEIQELLTTDDDDICHVVNTVPDQSKIEQVSPFPNTPGSIAYFHYPFDADDNTRESVNAAISLLSELEKSDEVFDGRNVADYTLVVKDFLLMASSFLTIFDRCDPKREGMDEMGFQTMLNILRDTNKSSFEPFVIRCNKYYGEGSVEWSTLQPLLVGLKNCMEELVQDCCKRGADFGFDIKPLSEILDPELYV